jgi:hypothetical protein
MQSPSCENLTDVLSLGPLAILPPRVTIARMLVNVFLLTDALSRSSDGTWQRLFADSFWQTNTYQ